MHIIIGLLTAVAGVVWALYRLQNSGVDLNSFNPFYWARRRRWEKQMSARPLHCLDHPMEAAAVLVVGMAELQGTLTRELKQKVTSLFSSEFNIPEKDALELFASSSHLLKDAMNVPEEVGNILAPSRAQYEPRHQESLVMMLRDVGRFDGRFTSDQEQLLNSVEREFASGNDKSRRW